MQRILLLLFCLFAGAALNAQEEDPGFHIFSIYFGGGSYYIDGEQVRDLYEWLDGFPDLEEYEIDVQSHTDNIGSLEYNQRLSMLRSRAAIQKLLEKGLPRDMIFIRDFGELNPVYDNATWEGKLRNRRVDIIIRRLVM